MSFLPLTSSEIEKLKNNAEFIKETVNQVIKDFALFGIGVHFSGNSITAYDELFEQLKKHLEILLKTNASKLQSLLYQIDVNPQKVFGGGTFSLNYLTDAILQREFQKVVTRWYFKNNT